MFKNWNTRDWFWLSSYFIVIISLLVANFYWNWETNLSIISSAASITLAIIAIFLSLKQDSDSKLMSQSMQQDIQSLHKEFIRKQSGYNKMLDEVQEVVDENIEIQGLRDQDKMYSHEELIEYGERIKHETIENFRAEVTEKLEENLKNNLIKYNKNNSFDIHEYLIFGETPFKQRSENNDKIDKIIYDNKDKRYREVKKILNEKGFDVPISIIINKLKEYREKDV